MMNDLLQDLVDRGKVIIYIDVIMIFTISLEEHHLIVQEVLQLLKKSLLFLKAEKCTFKALEVEYLCLIVSEGQICMDPVKVKGVSEWLTNRNKKDMQSFLGFANFYQRFINSYGELTCLLAQLNGKTEWIWGPKQEQTFKSLKGDMTKVAVLTIPKESHLFIVDCDASEGALGASCLKSRTTSGNQ
jgi:RNase H-like domain found in reverse transcriptase/Reverse transcriptase (RNA-dependent DNA polymerase)